MPTAPTVVYVVSDGGDERAAGPRGRTMAPDETGETTSADEPSDELTSEDEADSDDDDAPSERSSEQLIEDSQLFRALDVDDRKHLTESGEHVTFEPGDVILEEGEEGDSFYLIEDGEVEVSTNLSGKTVVLATLTRGAIFGEVSAFSGKPRTATVTAASLVEAYRFENQELKTLLERSPEVREELQAMVLGRARDTIEKITQES